MSWSVSTALTFLHSLTVGPWPKLIVYIVCHLCTNHPLPACSSKLNMSFSIENHWTLAKYSIGKFSLWLYYRYQNLGSHCLTFRRIHMRKQVFNKTPRLAWTVIVSFEMRKGDSQSKRSLKVEGGRIITNRFDVQGASDHIY